MYRNSLLLRYVQNSHVQYTVLLLAPLFLFGDLVVLGRSEESDKFEARLKTGGGGGSVCGIFRRQCVLNVFIFADDCDDCYRKPAETI